MTEKLRQSLSAVIDDEADAFELRRVLDELGHDQELRGLWERYHLIGNALRGECSALPAALPDRVWDALASSGEEPLAADPEADAGPATAAAASLPATAAPWRARAGRLTGLAVAASVAFAVVIGFNGLEPGEGPQGVQVAGAQDAPPAVSVAQTEESTVQPGSSDPSAGARLNLAADASPSDVKRAQAYILHHTQQQALNQAGVMSFVKMATYEAP